MERARRTFLKEVALGTGGLALSACGDSQTLEPSPQRPALSKASPDTLAPWRSLSSLERIRRLETKQYPQTSEFNTIDELVEATARFYCEVVRCKLSAETLRSRVSFVTVDQMIAKAEQDWGGVLPNEDRERVSTVLERVSTNNGLILVNPQNIDTNLEAIKRNQPGLERSVGNRDLRIIYYKSILFHAYTHTQASSEAISFPPIRLPAILDTEVHTLNKFLNFEGRRLSTGQTVYITGSGEAMTEYIAKFRVGLKTSIHLSPALYGEGAGYIDSLNQEAKISAEVFTEYYSGAKTTRELLRKWAGIQNPRNPDESRAIHGLVTIGLRVMLPDLVSQDITNATIRQLLRRG